MEGSAGLLRERDRDLLEDEDDIAIKMKCDPYHLWPIITRITLDLDLNIYIKIN